MECVWRDRSTTREEFYYTEGTEPEIGDVFNADIYEADSGEYLWVRMAP